MKNRKDNPTTCRSTEKFPMHDKRIQFAARERNWPSKPAGALTEFSLGGRRDEMEVKAFSPIWDNESWPAGTMMGLLWSTDTTLLQTKYKHIKLVSKLLCYVSYVAVGSSQKTQYFVIVVLTERIFPSFVQQRVIALHKESIATEVTSRTDAVVTYLRGVRNSSDPTRPRVRFVRPSALVLKNCKGSEL